MKKQPIIINVNRMLNVNAAQSPVLLPTGQVSILKTPAGALRIFPVRPHAAECAAENVTGMASVIEGLQHEGGFDPAQLIHTPVVTEVTIGEHVLAAGEDSAYWSARIKLNGNDGVEGAVHLSEPNVDSLRTLLTTYSGGRLNCRSGVLLGFNLKEQGTKQLTLVVKRSDQYLLSTYYTALYAAHPELKDVKTIGKTGKLIPGTCYFRKNGTLVVYLGEYAGNHIFLPYIWAKIFLESMNEIPEERFEAIAVDKIAGKLLDSITLRPNAEMFADLKKGARKTAVQKVEEYMNPMTPEQAQACLDYYVRRYVNKKAGDAFIPSRVASDFIPDAAIAMGVLGLEKRQVVNINGESVLRNYWLDLNREQFDALMANCFIGRGGKAMRIFLREHEKVCLLWKAPNHTYVVSTYDEPDPEKDGKWVKTRVGDDDSVYTADQIFEMGPQVLVVYGEDGTFKQCILGIPEDPERCMDVTRIVNRFSA